MGCLLGVFRFQSPHAANQALMREHSKIIPKFGFEAGEKGALADIMISLNYYIGIVLYYHIITRSCSDGRFFRFFRGFPEYQFGRERGRSKSYGRNSTWILHRNSARIHRNHSRNPETPRKFKNAQTKSRLFFGRPSGPGRRNRSFGEISDYPW